MRYLRLAGYTFVFSIAMLIVSNQTGHLAWRLMPSDPHKIAPVIGMILAATICLVFVFRSELKKIEDKKRFRGFFLVNVIVFLCVWFIVYPLIVVNAWSAFAIWIVPAVMPFAVVLVTVRNKLLLV